MDRARAGSMGKTHARLFSKTRQRPLVDVRWRVDARHVRVLNERLADDVHREALCGLDVARRVFRPSLRARGAGDRDDRRVMGHLRPSWSDAAQAKPAVHTYLIEPAVERWVI